MQSVIEARLAQLARRRASWSALAAAIGREFTVDVLAAAPEADEDAWCAAWTSCGGGGSCASRRSGTRYDFSHDRIRQVAYCGIGPARRRRLHRRIAGALERCTRERRDR